MGVAGERVADEEAVTLGDQASEGREPTKPGATCYREAAHRRGRWLVGVGRVAGAAQGGMGFGWRVPPGLAVMLVNARVGRPQYR